ncbi:MAG: radical SAM protein [Candidatus Thermoplasmatota archaeon]|jgi:DNA repair photolyase|nr:radical SAM protein [Candidatus Thermoplasmatota archaeon]
MEYKNIQCTTLLNKITKKDKLFKGKYTLDPYQNCEFGCNYCDSSYDKTIYVKANAVKQLEKEIKTIRKGTIIIGSVSDAYQKAEEKHKITRELLETIKQNNYPCHIITKSNLILRDIDLLTKTDSTVTITIITLDKKTSRIFEKKVPSPDERLKTVKQLSEKGIKTGIAIIPIIPYINENEIEEIIKTAKKHDAKYVLHKHLELKGDQKNIFIEIIKKFYPSLFTKYIDIYIDNYAPNQIYINRIAKSVNLYCKKYEIPTKI